MKKLLFTNYFDRNISCEDLCDWPFWAISTKHVPKIFKIKNQGPLINAILPFTGKKSIGSKQDEIFNNNKNFKSRNLDIFLGKT